MDTKLFILIVCTLQYACGAGLLRKPKVYNALITTDENLTPSRAFPLIQPTIHETGIASFPFGLHAFRYINPGPPSRFGPPGGEDVFRNFQPQPYGAFPKEQFPLDSPPNQIPESGPPPTDLAFPPHQAPPQGPQGEIRPPFALPHPPQNQQQPPIPPEAGRPPIPLNEFGLPPSLVPLPSFPRPQNPVNLQPFQFNSYPLIYDSYNQFPEQYLPPFGYYPPPTRFGSNASNNPGRPTQKPKEPEPLPEAERGPAPPALGEAAQNEPSSDNLKVQPVQPNVDGIKNISANRNSEVPDVPPPPIPSGAKIAK